MVYQTKVYRVLVAMLVAVVMAAMVAVNPTGAASKFTDVSDRYTDAVDYLVENNITNGYTETEFGTDLKIKRVDASVLLAKALELEVSNDDVSGFTDVPKRAEPYITALKEAGIVQGKTATYFAAQDNITRGEMALILTRGHELTGSGEELPFTDVAPRYTDAVDQLLTNGITVGKTDTTFGTVDNLKRGEFALFLYRLSQLEDTVDPAPVSKDDLQAVIDAIDELEESQYTEESWANLEDALADANETVANENATTEDVQTALDALSDAINRLVEKTVVESVVSLEVLNDGLLDGSISIEELLSNPEVLRLKLLPGSGLAVGDVIKIGTDDFNLLTLTLTEDDLENGFVNLELTTELLTTLTGVQTLDLVAVVETGEAVIESVLETIQLPVYPIVEPVIDLVKNTVDDLVYILAGEKDLRIDIAADDLEQVQANDILKLTINGKERTKVITQEDIDRGYVEYTFSDSNFLENLLEGLTTGSEIVITPEIISDGDSAIGTTVTYELTEGIIESLVDLLGDILGDVLGGVLGLLGR